MFEIKFYLIFFILFNPEIVTQDVSIFQLRKNVNYCTMDIVFFFWKHFLFLISIRYESLNMQFHRKHVKKRYVH